jgi:uncharacterized protein YdaU (DUF1376 family)
MNYFPFNIGDYSAHTGHLEPMEDLAYRRLLDHYYLVEGPLPIDVQATAKLIRMRSMVADVESVLIEFFILTDEGWTNPRCDKEIERMQDKQRKARASAAASVKARQAFVVKKGNERSTNVEISSTDVELPTPTPTPTPTRIIKNTNTATFVAPPVGVSFSVWNDFCQLRKTKRAVLTETALEVIRREAQKAGWTLEDALRESCARGWMGFKASWVDVQAMSQRNGKPTFVTTVPSSSLPDPALEKIRLDRLKAVPMPADVRTKINELFASSGR